MAQRYDIFISYRRKGGVETARLVDIKLREQGYYVSFDIDTLGKGKFTDTLRTRLQGCIDFVVIFEPTYYERFFESGSLDENGKVKPDAKLVSQDVLNEDWCYLELKNALTLGKNVIPIIKRDFRFPNNLPPEVKDIAEMNAIEVTEKEFKEIFENKVPLYLDSKPKFTFRYRKPIIAVLSLMIMGIIAILVSFGVITYMDNLKAAEAMIQQAAETEARIKAQEERAAFVADSIQKAGELLAVSAMQSVKDSVKAAENQRRAAASAATSQKKEIYWVGGDEIGKILRDKLNSSGAGIKTSGNCSGNSFKVAASKASCPPSAIGNVKCSYTPQLTITNCGGTQVDKLASQTISSTGKDENLARQKLHEALQSTNFSAWVSRLKSLRN
ncbi:MAG: TIR domain-containing protein [Fibromonadales bacterium]|nr:TIR domain-containing protein [Fibromonadales bacterium]